MRREESSQFDAENLPGQVQMVDLVETPAAAHTLVTQIPLSPLLNAARLGKTPKFSILNVRLHLLNGSGVPLQQGVSPPRAPPRAHAFGSTRYLAPVPFDLWHYAKRMQGYGMPRPQLLALNVREAPRRFELTNALARGSDVKL